jgi:alpha-galactosidase
LNPGVPSIEPSTPFSVTAGSTGWAWCVDDDGELRQLAVGPGAPSATADLPSILYPRALPTFGTEPHRRTALRATHHDGTRSTRLVVRDIDRTDTPGGERLSIEMEDPQFDFTVHLVTETWTDEDVVAQHLEITNGEPGPVTVWEAASSAPLLFGPAPTWTHVGGGWAAEWTPTHEALHDSVKVVESTGGIRPNLQVMPVVLVSPDGDWAEESGTVLAGQLAWTGNACFEAEVRGGNSLRLLCGASLRASELVLDPGETVRLPEMVWAWSDAGVGPVSRRLHRWVRRLRVRDGERDRAIVANNWEATFFDFDETRLVGLARDAADLGAELFLLDDGWFGRSHPRDDDTQGLGDWEVDPGKLPNGLEPVIAATLDAGLRFGLWVEPEMVNPRSTLFEQHPEWVLGDPVRPKPNIERHQLALDLLQPEVRDFVVDTVDRLLAEHPDVSYVKWDANRALVDTGSRALPPDKQGRVFFDLVGATYDVMERIAEHNPDVELMLCASGGGRVDLAALPWFHEVWTSDNTDPVERVRMQWVASWFLPATVVGAHVTRWGGRPIAFGAAVALSARFGWDLDPAGLTDDEKASLRAASALYKRIRPLVQRGELHRLRSPFDGPSAALAYVDVDDGRAVVFGYQLAAAAVPEPPVVVPGLDPATDYEVTASTLLGEPTTTTSVGADLTGAGLAWPLTAAETAMIWEITPAG